VPVKVTDENGLIVAGDFLAVSATKPGFAMKAIGSVQVIGQALENDNATGVVSMFVHNFYYVPNVSTMLQSAGAVTTTLQTDLSALNITNASMFGDIVVTGQLYVQKDLTVKGIIHTPELRAEKIVTKQLCLDEICITKEQLKAILEATHTNSSAPLPSENNAGAAGSGDSTGTEASSITDPGIPAASEVNPPADPPANLPDNP
jgi:hypothetical protein